MEVLYQLSYPGGTDNFSGVPLRAIPRSGELVGEDEVDVVALGLELPQAG